MDIQINFFKDTKINKNPLRCENNISISSIFDYNSTDIISNFILNEYLEKKSPSK